MKPYRLQSPAEVDLDQHGLIEASAGTGKTYTLENLIVRLLVEHQVESIRQILIVTFTEKATSELKARVREKLEETLQSPSDLTLEARQRLLISQDMFDEAGIYTIHGFCSRVLRDFAFENQELFLNETIADQSDLARQAVAEVFRDFMAGEELAALQALSFFRLSAHDLQSEVQNLATRAWVDDSGVLFEHADGVLLPQQTVHPGAGVENEIGSFTEIAARVDHLFSLSQPIFQDILNWAAADFPAIWPASVTWGVRQTAKGEIHGTDRKKVMGRVHEARRYKDETPLPETEIARKVGLIHWVYQIASPSRRDCSPMAEMVEEVEQMRYGLIVRLGLRAATRLRWIMEREGKISFDGLLRKILEALEGSRSDLLTSRIQQRWPMALVDEFQDTDPLQWEIFSRVWLNGGGRTRLYLIGDPKQAIYAFRGADVFTYLQARSAMHEEARVYSLGTNYRSHPELVEFFNAVFQRSAWFGNDCAGSSIRHFRIEAGKGVAELIEQDETHRPSAMAVGAESTADWAQGIAREIRGLVQSRTLKIRDGDASRWLHYGDCAVLIQSRSNAFSELRKAFSQWGIPWSSYRQPGLFQSVEADAFRLMLKNLTHAEEGDFRRFLSSPWLGYSPGSRQFEEALDSGSIWRKVLLEWREMGVRRRIPALIYQILETAPLFEACQRRQESYLWERRQTNFYQLAEILTLQASSEPMALTDLSVWLDRVCLGLTDADEETRDCMRQDTEEPRVSVLTMHVSKGLEFPVVFLLPNTAERKRAENGLRVHLQDHSSWLGYSQKAHEIAHKEQSEERLRLLYVAMTRSRLKLYWPVYEKGRGVIHNALSDAAELAGAWFLKGLPEVPPAASTAPEEPVETELDPFLREPVGPQLQSEFSLRSRKVERTSFSSMLRHLDAEALQFGDSHAVVDEIEDPLDQEDELPRGRSFGNLIHDLLEHLDWQKAGTENFLTQEYFERLALRYDLEPSLYHPVKELLRQVLCADLGYNLQGYCLKSLAGDRILREPDFCTRFPGGQDLKGYLEGAIDLIFEVKGCYYVADWKSNHLISYTPQSLQRSMEHSGYLLQARIYALALLRWLQSIWGADASAHFGGVYYFFVRGMSRPQEGLWFQGPESLSLPELELEISQRLRLVYQRV